MFTYIYQCCVSWQQLLKYSCLSLCNSVVIICCHSNSIQFGWPVNGHKWYYSSRLQASPYKYVSSYSCLTHISVPRSYFTATEEQFEKLVITIFLVCSRCAPIFHKNLCRHLAYINFDIRMHHQVGLNILLDTLLITLETSGLGAFKQSGQDKWIRSVLQLPRPTTVVKYFQFRTHEYLLLVSSCIDNAYKWGVDIGSN